MYCIYSENKWSIDSNEVVCYLLNTILTRQPQCLFQRNANKNSGCRGTCQELLTRLPQANTAFYTGAIQVESEALIPTVSALYMAMDHGRTREIDYIVGKP